VGGGVERQRRGVGKKRGREGATERGSALMERERDEKKRGGRKRQRQKTLKTRYQGLHKRGDKGKEGEKGENKPRRRKKKLKKGFNKGGGGCPSLISRTPKTGDRGREKIRAKGGKAGGAVGGGVAFPELSIFLGANGARGKLGRRGQGGGGKRKG